MEFSVRASVSQYILKTKILKEKAFAHITLVMDVNTQIQDLLVINISTTSYSL